jgi:hypothetical protein
MQKKVLVVFACLATAFGLAGVARADLGDACEDLVFSSERLEGLCELICESIQCQPDMDGDSSGDDGSSEDASSGDECDPPSQFLIDLYNNGKTPDDPDLPCIVLEASCPCFTQEEVDAIPPTGNCYVQCTYENVDAAGDLLTNIIGRFSDEAGNPALEVAQVVEQSATAGTCLYQAPDLPAPRFFDIGVEEIDGCKQIIQSTQDTFNLCVAPIGTCIP